MSTKANISRAQQLARTLLYEGYILYPYRLSAIKNRHRWTFGTLYPELSAAVSEGGERSYSQTEVLLRSNQQTMLNIRLQFLQLIETTYCHPAMTSSAPQAEFSEVACMQEAVERVVDGEFELTQIVEKKRDLAFSFAPPIVEKNQGTLPKAAEKSTIEGILTLSAQQCAPNVFKVTVRSRNSTSLDGTSQTERALFRSMLSAHLVLGVRGGQFLSILDPPDGFHEYTAGCENIGSFPVLVGDPGQADTFLCPPIALSDYPQVAPESAGDFFDATEIDELLTLRVMTLTEEEKKEIRAGDPRAAEILARIETLGFDHLAELHGALRGLKPLASSNQENTGPRTSNGLLKLRKGDRVRLRPNRRADVMDLALAGCTGIVEAIEHDYDNRTYVAVVVENDPGADLGLLRQPGHRFFFSPDEVERIPKSCAGETSQ
jgi:hypothetical protein